MLVLSRATSAAVAHNMRITGSSTVKSERPKLGIARAMSPVPVMPPVNCAATGLSGRSWMRGAIHDAKIGPASAAVGSPTRMAYAIVRPTSAW